MMIGLMAAVLVAFPGRLALARGQARMLADRWARANDYENARVASMIRLNEAAGPEDRSAVDQAIAGLYNEEAAHLDRLAGQLGVSWLFGGGLRSLRGAVLAALRGEAADLRAVAKVRAGRPGRLPPDQSVSTERAVGVATSRLAGQLRRFQLRPTHPASAHLYAGDAALTRLSHWLDQPVGGAILVASTDRGELRLDIDGSRAVDVVGWPGGPLIVRGKLIMAAGGSGSVLAGPADAGTPPRPMAAGDSIFAAGRPDAVWVLTNSLTASAASITEVDSHGRQLVGPVPFLVDQSLDFELAVPTGVVVRTPGSFGLEIWDPGNRKVVRVIADHEAQPLAVSGDGLAWIDTSSGGRLHLTDTSTGADRIVVAPGLPVPAGPGQFSSDVIFSPDGRRLAYYSDISDPSGLGGNTLTLTVLDVISGTVTTPSGPISQNGSGTMAWTTDSTRLFYTVNLSSGRPELVTYRIGDAFSHPLRYRDFGGNVSSMLAIAH